MVSHDREFLNNVVQSTIAFDADGIARTYVGGYSDWLRQRPDISVDAGVSREKKVPLNRQRKSGNSTSRSARSWNCFPQQIEELESGKASLHSRFSDPDLYKKAPENVASIQSELDEIEKRLMQLYERWEVWMPLTSRLNRLLHPG